MPRRRPRWRSPPARRRPTWIATRSRACSASSRARCASARRACGGGFGGKLDVSVQPLLAVAALGHRRPVRIVYSRTESMASTTKRHPASIWAKASADADGRLTAFEMEADFNTGAYASWGPTVANRVPVHASRALQGAERLEPHARGLHQRHAGRRLPRLRRAAGGDRHETLMDDLAEGLGLDRWAIRRINALGRGDTTPSGQVLDASAGLPECLDALKPDWDAALARVASSQRRGRRGGGAASASPACGTAAATPRCPTRRPCASRCRATARSPSSTARSISARARPPCCCRSPPTRSACRRQRSSWWSATPT